MPESRPRSLLASIIGWLIVAVIVYFFFGWIFGAALVFLRFVMILVVIGALLALYFKVRGGD
jgi:hypothetical protein